jgi:hypothetical protein
MLITSRTPRLLSAAFTGALAVGLTLAGPAGPAAAATEELKAAAIDVGSGYYDEAGVAATPDGTEYIGLQDNTSDGIFGRTGHVALVRNNKLAETITVTTNPIDASSAGGTVFFLGDGASKYTGKVVTVNGDTQTADIPITTFDPKAVAARSADLAYVVGEDWDVLSSGLDGWLLPVGSGATALPTERIMPRPEGIAIGKDGTLFVAGYAGDDSAVPTGGELLAIAPNGTRTTVPLDGKPQAVAVGPDGTVWVTSDRPGAGVYDSYLYAIQGGKITHIVHVPTSTGNLAVTPSGTVYGVGGLSRFAVRNATVVAQSNNFIYDKGIAVAPNGRVYAGSHNQGLMLLAADDATRPTFPGAPALSVRTGTVSATAAPVALTWKAADNHALAQVQATSPAKLTFGPTATVWNTTIRPGGNVVWALTARDTWTNTATASVTRSAALITEGSGHRSGTWRVVKGKDYLGGQVLTAGGRNAALAWTVTGRSVGLTAVKGPTQGRVLVYVDGHRITTVDLHASRTADRQIVWTRTWSTAGSHTVKIVVEGTAGRPGVATDGLTVIH